MRRPSIPSPVRPVLAAIVALSLSGCDGLARLSEVGKEPVLTHIQSPTATPGYQPVRMPMPSPVVEERRPSSLWRTGARAFFKDQRAARIGDILTVQIAVDDSAKINNTTTRKHSAAEDAGLGKFLGLEGQLKKVLPDAVDPGALVDLNSSSNNTGTGVINRDEKIELKVAATVAQILPNGNLVIAGRQEMRVNFEVRDLQVAGIVRPEDITAENTVSFDKIAEGRISYGGRGRITDVQQPRYGQQIIDILAPF